ncbi:MAG: X-Pro dipeptidyl-peptidase [Cyclobacteriaceae bacterium]|nr:MAG: X-Pro dipeptidyl-peptidase [Cyclobacteriaceae bacterium]
MKKHLLCLLLLPAGLTGVAQTGLLFRQTSEVHHLMVNFEADRGSLMRFYTIANSPERRERLKEFYTSYLKQLEELPFETFSQGGKVDYILFKRNLEDALYQLSVEEKEYNQIRKYVAMADPLYELEKKRRRGYTLNSEEVAQTLNQVRRQMEEAMQQLSRQPSLPPEIINRAVETVGGLKNALRSVYGFYNQYDPLFTWWVQKPCQQLDTLLGAYAQALKKKTDMARLPKDDGSGIIGQPIGRDEIIRQLRLEFIPYTPEELIDIAQKEFAWCDREMLKASAELGFGNDWKKALEKVKQSFVPPGRQPEAMLDLYNQSVDFLKKNDLITIPPLAEETWRMRMMTPEQQLVSPFFLGGELFQISYPTQSMDHEDKLMSMRGNNPHFSRATVHHELIAGHHLQQFMNNRNKAYRNFRTPFWTEGWALYWEMILWDMNFPRNAEDRIGMLFWRMHRCARIIFSLNYHLGVWTPRQCIDFLVDRVGHERANAEGEVRRSFTGRYGPLYQLAYMMGALQFYALKKELVDSGKMTYKQFHDAVMAENSMPVELLRALLTNAPLSRNFSTQWRFYGR